MKSYAKTILLKNNPGLIAEYMMYHDDIWPEVVKSFRAVGVVDIRIWIIGRQLFMVMDTKDSFDPNRDMERYLQLNPKNREWEEKMKTYQEPITDYEHWAELELIFKLSDHAPDRY
ncbi:L-rhamnose mutarotase [Cytophagaceae bacterium DM2B3-1]|uniref:L-rhamnose mutarotase n=1 Tax=Xanthocytophaga flava TaxID=3048013 RepID=A0AAE3QHE8_9BACT|nr:L-rhamnose mutarotase [Xanthocytophaga flavus]MDJ1471982.1 L-rhamnose mutarotase [Xanthocytophaga flavus]MDJ1479422.1 L-rhamnose mutarotase [Xanthocytophaga flavus]MDJ1492767.1 L-rhamnose mutarotase [Xanthocytophaga flavus]